MGLDGRGDIARLLSDVKQTNALMVTLIESDGKCPLKEAVQTNFKKTSKKSLYTSSSTQTTQLLGDIFYT